jgi:dUTP pyrophosphatase
MKLVVELKILDSRVRDWGFPFYGSKMAAGVDLFACLETPVELRPQAEPLLISSGISVRIGNPEWCALIVPRSGIGHREGLVLGNSIGVIDADYEGPCMVSAWNRTPFDPAKYRAILINPGDRIAQLLFVRSGRPTFKIVKEFRSPSNRGTKGWGSTGT